MDPPQITPMLLVSDSPRVAQRTDSRANRAAAAATSSPIGGSRASACPSQPSASEFGISTNTAAGSPEDPRDRRPGRVAPPRGRGRHAARPAGPGGQVRSPDRAGAVCRVEGRAPARGENARRAREDRRTRWEGVSGGRRRPVLRPERRIPRRHRERRQQRDVHPDASQHHAGTCSGRAIAFTSTSPRTRRPSNGTTRLSLTC